MTTPEEVREYVEMSNGFYSFSFNDMVAFATLSRVATTPVEDLLYEYIAAKENLLDAKEMGQ